MLTEASVWLQGAFASWTPFQLGCLGFFALVVLLLSVRGFFKNIRKARFIKNTPTSKVRSAAQGYVEIEGQSVVSKRGALKTPYDDTNCVWFFFQIEALQMRIGADGKPKEEWNVIHTETSKQPFWAKDDTGHCLIMPRGADVKCQTKKVWDSYNTPGILAAMVIPGLTFGTEKHRFTLRYLPVEVEMHCYGAFKTLSDKTQLEAHAQGEEIQHHGDHFPIHVMSREGLNKRPYIISDKKEAALARGYYWRSIFSVVIAVVAIGAVVISVFSLLMK